jgi:hypothetical protein
MTTSWREFAREVLFAAGILALLYSVMASSAQELVFTPKTTKMISYTSPVCNPSSQSS